MKRLVPFIACGLLTTIPGEILNQVLARHDLGAFRSTMISDVVLLFIGFFVAKGLCRLFRKRCYAALTNLYLSVAVLLPKEKGGLFLGFVIFATGYVGLNYHFWQYFQMLKRPS